MALIGVRELREHTAEVLRKVREEQAAYVITLQGHPIALLSPIDAQAVEAAMLEASKQSAMNGWEVYTLVAQTLRKTWPEGQSTQALVDEIRRE